MAITYVCRHCRAFQGRIDSNHVSEARLGFDSLTPEERKDIIAYDFNGEVMVRVTCDHCREALEAHPELSLLANPCNESIMGYTTFLVEDIQRQVLPLL